MTKQNVLRSEIATALFPQRERFYSLLETQAIEYTRLIFLVRADSPLVQTNLKLSDCGKMFSTFLLSSIGILNLS